jgi:hypothetical protein
VPIIELLLEHQADVDAYVYLEQAVPFERKMRCIGVRGRPLDFTDEEEIMELLIGCGATSTLDHLHGDDDEPETITILHRMNPQVLIFSP